MSDYRNVFNLTAHRDRKTPDELLSLSIRTAMFVVLLRHGGYFGNKETPYGAVMSQAEAVVAGVLFHTQEGITYNLHQVSYLNYLHAIYTVSTQYLRRCAGWWLTPPCPECPRPTRRSSARRCSRRCCCSTTRATPTLSGSTWTATR